MRLSHLRITIGQVMTLVALAALNLAVARATPWEIVIYPTLWAFLGTIDFVVLWKVVLRRPLRAFQYTCLTVFIVAYLVTVNLVATERFHPLGPLIRWYQQHAAEGANTISIPLGYVMIGEVWAVCFLSLALACAIGTVAAWMEKRHGWDIAAFFRGSLVGFGVFNLLAMIEGAIWGWEVESRGRLIGRLVVLGACWLMGGLMGLSRLRSNLRGNRGARGAGGVPVADGGRAEVSRRDAEVRGDAEKTEKC